MSIYNERKQALARLQVYDQDPNLVALYRFQGNFLDSSGEGNTGTNNGVTFEDSGYLDKAGVFDGSSNVIITDTLTNSLATTTEGTWMAWVKPSSVPDGSDAGDYREIICFSRALGDEYCITIFIIPEVAPGHCVAYLDDGTTYLWTIYSDAIPFTAGVWTHLALIHDDSYPVLYVNGQYIAQTLVGSDPTAWFADLDELDEGYIGRYMTHDPDVPFHWRGDMDEVRIYDKAFPATFIKQYYDTTYFLHNNPAATYPKFLFRGKSYDDQAVEHNHRKIVSTHKETKVLEPGKGMRKTLKFSGF